MRQQGLPAIERIGAVERLGPEWDPLFGAGPGVQSSRAWFAATTAAALPVNAAPVFLAVRDAAGALALFPMLERPGQPVTSLSTPYTCLYQPLLRPGAGSAETASAMAAFAEYCRRWAVIRLEALDADWPGLVPLADALRRAGLAARTFAHFANWHAQIPPGGWTAYLQSRPGALRETIRRRTRAAERDPEIRLEIARTGLSLAAALQAYETVYAQSWKEQEPFPEFNNALVDALRPSGALRIFVMWRGPDPIAAQYWTVTGAKATVLKLAHREQDRALSPGTVLTAFAIRMLIEQDGVAELDFGRGDDPYKQAWTGERRMRIGLLGMNMRRATGLMTLARHEIGLLRRAWKMRGPFR